VFSQHSLITLDHGKLLISVARISILRLSSLHGDFNIEASHVNGNFGLSNSTRCFCNLLENDNGKTKRLVSFSIDGNTASFNLSEPAHSFFNIFLSSTVRHVAQLNSVRVNNFLITILGFFSLLFGDNFFHVESSLSLNFSSRNSSILSGFFLESFILFNIFDLVFDIFDVFRLGSLLFSVLALTVLGGEISFFHLDLIVRMPDVITLDHGESTVTTLSFKSRSDSKLGNGLLFASHETLRNVSGADKYSSLHVLLKDVSASVFNSNGSRILFVSLVVILVFKSVSPLQEASLFVSLH
jgi:hypothetical protein